MLINLFICRICLKADDGKKIAAVYWALIESGMKASTGKNWYYKLLKGFRCYLEGRYQRVN